MRKTVLLNSNISSVISRMGHTDMLTVGDCGLPIPDGVERIEQYAISLDEEGQWIFIKL